VSADTATEPRLIAHRGFAGRYPENTVAAVEAAARDGAAMVEVDVLPCGDGDPVVFHDERLDAGGEGAAARGITDATGVVWETPRETVRAAEVLDSGETVPTLAEVVRALDAAPTDVGLVLDLKHPGTPETSMLPGGTDADRAVRRRRWEPFVERVLDVVAGFGGDLLVSAFDAAALAAARELDPDASLAVLFADDPLVALSTAERLDADALHPPVDAVLPEAPGPATAAGDRASPAATDAADGPPPVDGTPDVVALAREAGLDVNVWTVRTWIEAARLVRAGVDGVIADYPGLLDGW